MFRSGPIWIVLSILCAFFLALTDLFTKKYSGRFGAGEIAFGRIVYSVPVLWLYAVIDGIPAIDARIGWVYLLALPLETVALLLYIQALSLSPLSLTTPFLSFTPVFLVLTSPLMLGEYPSASGIIGIILIVSGAYLINVRSVRQGILYPFSRILHEKGPLLMLIVAFIYSLTSNFGKMGVLYSSPSFFAASYFSLLALVFSFPVIKRSGMKAIFAKELVLIGALSSIMISFHMAAIRLVQVSYMISIKRSSLLFGIVFGVLFLKETGLREKLVAGLVMVLGMLIISFAG